MHLSKSSPSVYQYKFIAVILPCVSAGTKMSAMNNFNYIQESIVDDIDLAVFTKSFRPLLVLLCARALSNNLVFMQPKNRLDEQITDKNSQMVNNLNKSFFHFDEK